VALSLAPEDDPCGAGVRRLGPLATRTELGLVNPFNDGTRDSDEVELRLGKVNGCEASPFAIGGADEDGEVTGEYELIWGNAMP
jgi:hypothetical protein